MLFVLALLAALPTAEELIARNAEARGGLAKLLAVKSQRLRGRISFGKGAPRPFTVEMKRGGKMREEVALEGGSFIRATDGKKGFVIAPGQPLRALDAGELRNVAGGADFDGPLVESKLKGVKLVVLGVEDVAGKPAFKLEVTLKDGQVRHDFLDQQTSLAVKWAGSLQIGGREVRMETTFADFRAVGPGLKMPFALESRSAGSDDVQRIDFEAIEVDPPVDDARFERP